MKKNKQKPLGSVASVSVRQRRRRARVMVLCAVAPIAAALAPMVRSSNAAVQLSSVASGSASVVQNGAVTTIRTANNSILYFSRFDIAPGSTVNFAQPSAASRVLDHVTSATPSLINGNLFSNGTVYLINPAGVIFGSGAVVDVNGFITAASHMSDQDFLNHVDHFSGISGMVSNSGLIQANQVSLIGSQVINQGSIVAPNGAVAMLAGSDVLVSQQGSHVMATVVPATSSATPSSAAQTDLRMSPMAAGDVYSLAIRHTGSIQASNVLINGGGGAVQVSGSITATANNLGGSVAITGGQVNLVSANINASGASGGGTVEIGGGLHGGGDLPHADSVSLDSNTVVHADATQNGDGGTIAVWSDGNTATSATLTARGGPLGGNGGFIETSGEFLQLTNAPDASAPKGDPGTWLLDPLNLEIINGADQGTSTFTGQSTITNGTITTALNGGNNVTITTTQAGADTGTLSQDANAPIDVALASTQTLSLHSDDTMTLSGGIVNTGSSPLVVLLDSAGPISISAAITTGGGNFGVTSATGFTTTTGGTISTTGGGSVSIAPAAGAAVQIGDAITTGGGTLAVSGASFTNSGTGTLTTGGGNLVITTTGADTVDAAVSTGAGTFSATGSTSFTNNASGTITTTDAALTIGSSGTVGLSGALATSGGSLSVGGTSFTVNTGATITTGGGNFAITASGVDSIGAAISTGAGNFSASGTTFTTTTGGTLSATSGNLNVTNTGAVGIGATIGTTTGTVAFTGASSFTNTAAITTAGGEVDIDPAGPVTIGAGITISAASGGVFIDFGNSGTPAAAANGTVAVNAAVSTTGGVFDSGGTTFNNTATITTNNGSVAIAATGADTIGAAISSGTGSLSITGNSSLVNTGTLASTSGNIILSSTGGITLGAGVSTTTGTVSVTGGTAFTANAGINTAGGAVSITAPAIDALNAAVSTGGGNFTVSGDSSFTTSAPATISTGGGNVILGSTGAIQIGDTVNTGGGGFSATGPTFQNGASGTISDGGTATAGKVFLIETTGTTTIGGALTWAGGTGRTMTIEAGGNLTVNAEISSTGATAMPLTLFETNAADTVSLQAAVDISGNFTSAGGTFTQGNVTAAPITALSVLINTATITTDSLALSNGSVQIDSPIVATGAGSIQLGGTSLVNSSALGTITANGGSLVITNTGEADFGAAIATGGGAFTATSLASFTTAAAATISTSNTTTGVSGGSVMLQTNSPTGIVIGAAVSTGGGGFSAVTTGNGVFQSTSTASISDNGIGTAAGALSINTAPGTGTVDVGGAISWTGGTGRSVTIEGGTGDLTIEAGATISSSSAAALPVTIFSTGTANTLAIDAPINTTGAFAASGGEFIDVGQTAAPTGGVTALSITVNVATTDGNGNTITPASNFIKGPLLATGNSTTGTIDLGGTTILLISVSAPITTNGGNVILSNTGDSTIGAPVITNGGSFIANSAPSFSNSSGGTITTAGGNVSITSTDTSGTDITDEINTGGGSFTSISASFQSTAEITDGGVAKAGGAFLIDDRNDVPNSSGTLNVDGAVNWVGGTGRSIVIEGGDSLTIDTGGTITGTGAALPITVLTTNASGTITLNTSITTTGGLSIDGGSFTLASTGAITAQSVNIDTSTSVLSNTVVNGDISLNAPVITTGDFTTTGGTSFTTVTGATITSNGGNVTIQSTGTVVVGDTINTGGGNFTASASIFTNTGVISDGGINDSNAQGLSITTTSGDINLNAALDWAASMSPITLSPAAGQDVELGADITANPAEAITLTSAPLALTSATETISGGNITIGTIINGISGGMTLSGDLTIASSSTVTLGAVGTTTLPIGNLSIAANGGAAPVTSLTGDINFVGRLDLPGSVTLPTANITIDAQDSEDSSGDIIPSTIEFDGKIQGPMGLTLILSGNNGDGIFLNNNIGDVTPLAFLDLVPNQLGLVFIRGGPDANGDLPTPAEQQPATVIDIASGGNLELNDVTPDPRNFSPIFASLGSYGPLTINIGTSGSPNAANQFVMGQNEKLTAYGNLNINTNGGTAFLGDLNSFGSMTISASVVHFELRGPTTDAGLQLDTGLDYIADGEMSLPSNATYIADHTSGGSFDVPGFLATSFSSGSNIATLASQFKTAFSIIPGVAPTAYFLPGNVLRDLTPSTLTGTIPTFIPPTPFVYDFAIAGAVPRDQLVAGTVPRDFKVADQPVLPGPIVQQDMKDSGALTRDPSLEEILAAVDGVAVYDDMPTKRRPRPSDYATTVNRLDSYNVSQFLAKYQEVFAGPYRRTQMSVEIQQAWDAYVNQNGYNPATGEGFQKFCDETPSAAKAAADLSALNGLKGRLDRLGLSNKETQVVFRNNVLDELPANGMQEGDLVTAIRSAGDTK